MADREDKSQHQCFTLYFKPDNLYHSHITCPDITTTMNKNGNGAPREQYIKQCRKLVLKAVQGQFVEYIDYLSEKLFQLADKAASNQEQARIFEARDIIMQQNSLLGRQFVTHIQLAFNAFSRHKNTVSQAFINDMKEQENLSLVDNDELEESIALKTMCRKAENFSSL